MENYKTHRDTAMREVLLYVCEHKDMPDDAHEQDKAKIVKECADIGYLEGIRAIKTLDGCVHFAATQPFVTQKGLAFLYPENELKDSSLGRIEIELKHQTKKMDELKQDAAQKVSEYDAKHNEEKRSEQLQAAKDKKQSFRHDFIVAGFSAILVFVIDHLDDVVDLIKKIFSFFSQ